MGVRTMVNLASNHRRGLGRLRHAMSRLAIDATSSVADHYPSDLAHLAALRPEARAVLFMQHVEGMPTREKPLGGLAESLVATIMQPPPYRPGGGGSAP